MWTQLTCNLRSSGPYEQAVYHDIYFDVDLKLQWASLFSIQSFMLNYSLMPSVLPLATAQEDFTLASLELSSLKYALRSPANLVHLYKPLGDQEAVSMTHAI